MSQVSKGTVTVTNDSARVISSLNEADEVWQYILPGSLFAVTGDNVPYWVATVTTPGDSDSGFWELNLSAPYDGTTGAGKTYAATNDFTPRLGLPLIYRGDAESAVLYSVAMGLIDQLVLANTFSHVSGNSNPIAELPVGAQLRVKWTFSSVGVFAYPNFQANCRVVIGGTHYPRCVAFEDTNVKTTGSCSWLVQLGDDMPVAYGDVINNVAFQAKALGLGWTGAGLTANGIWTYELMEF